MKAKSAWSPCAWAMPATISPMRRSIIVWVVSRKVLTVPIISTWSGMTLKASPPATRVTETTALSMGSTSRATRLWKAWIISEAAMIGSRPWFGIAAWQPRPLTMTWKRSAAAIAGPLHMAKLPTGSQGQLCIPKIRSAGKRSNSPSSIIALPPEKPSSAGWKIR